MRAELCRETWALTSIKILMLVTDLGFLGYWAATALALIPPELAYSDYQDPRLVAWNWSFLPVDLIISATGILAVRWVRIRPAAGYALMLISLTLTHASGLFAISFWAIRADVRIEWWAPNLVLLPYPVPALLWLIKNAPAARCRWSQPASPCGSPALSPCARSPRSSRSAR